MLSQYWYITFTAAFLTKGVFMDMNNKLENLYKYLKNLENIAVAFSGGVDSTLLLKAAKNVLDNNVIAVTINSSLVPKRENKEVTDFCKNENIKHFIFEKDVFEINGFADNPLDRCYICKKALFSEVIKIAQNNGIKNITEGSNIDDTNDYRPGLKAIKELGIKSPFIELGLTKNEIRQLSKEMNLPTWKKPSFACLASRFAYGEEITKKKLNMIDKAEQMLFDLEFKQFRVRIHNNMARIEVVKNEFEKILEYSSKINNYFKEIGFDYVTMDLEGYRTGSMNEVLNLREDFYGAE